MLGVMAGPQQLGQDVARPRAVGERQHGQQRDGLARVERHGGSVPLDARGTQEHYVDRRHRAHRNDSWERRTTAQGNFRGRWPEYTGCSKGMRALTTRMLGGVQTWMQWQPAVDGGRATPPRWPRPRRRRRRSDRERRRAAATAAFNSAPPRRRSAARAGRAARRGHRPPRDRRVPPRPPGRLYGGGD